MSFYYPSIFSFIFLAVLYAVVLGLIWLVWVKLAKRKFSGPAAWGVVALVIVAPWLEEFWIAWHFGRLCKKDAGLVVHQVVEVEGFYSDPATGSLELVKSGGYKFIESKSDKGVNRIEIGDADFLRQATERYQQENPNQIAAEKDYFRVKLDSNTEALVYPKKSDGWRITNLNRPTARYHYTRNIYGENVAHKITRVEARVADSRSGNVIGRYVSYGRGPYWFYIDLGRPPYSCDGPDGGPSSRYNSLIYRDTLKPASK